MKVVRDLFALEPAITKTEDKHSAQKVAGLTSVASHLSQDGITLRESAADANSNSSDKAPLSSLNAMLMFVTASLGDPHSKFALESYCRLLQESLTPGRVGQVASSETAVPQGEPLGSSFSPSEASTAAGDHIAVQCQLDYALVCLDTNGNGTIEFDELLAASMGRADFKEREPACRYEYCGCLAMVSLFYRDFMMFFLEVFCLSPLDRLLMLCPLYHVRFQRRVSGLGSQPGRLHLCKGLIEHFAL